MTAFDKSRSDSVDRTPAERYAETIARDEAGEPLPSHAHTYVDYLICRKCGRTEADLSGTCHHCSDPTSIQRGQCWWCLKVIADPVQPQLAPPTSQPPAQGHQAHATLIAKVEAAKSRLNELPFNRADDCYEVPSALMQALSWLLADVLAALASGGAHPQEQEGPPGQPRS